MKKALNNDDRRQMRCACCLSNTGVGPHSTLGVLGCYDEYSSLQPYNTTFNGLPWCELVFHDQEDWIPDLNGNPKYSWPSDENGTDFCILKRRLVSAVKKKLNASK